MLGWVPRLRANSSLSGGETHMHTGTLTPFSELLLIWGKRLRARKQPCWGLTRESKARAVSRGKGSSSCVGLQDPSGKKGAPQALSESWSALPAEPSARRKSARRGRWFQHSRQTTTPAAHGLGAVAPLSKGSLCPGPHVPGPPLRMTVGPLAECGLLLSHSSED